ncbi:hypothetical protein PDJAM_G00079000 [Pangasius djambal]|uniref:Uncharacterized protein n=1 Tax=Pangasius djambal TaxID=1691987 RepID=A0ACC5Z4T8_9TELE|nr:hypothetical protein [Pangasius djambal]
MSRDADTSSSDPQTRSTQPALDRPQDRRDRGRRREREIEKPSVSWALACDPPRRELPAPRRTELIRMKSGFVWFRLCAVTLLTLALSQHCLAIRWLALSQTSEHINKTQQCKSLPGLVSSQAQLCRTNLEVMQVIVQAAREVKKTCQKTFSDMRWNCSSIEAPKYLPDLERGTRESAFVYALAAAAISHTIARACTSGDLRLCTCGPIPGDALEPGHRWGGCTDNLHYGLIMGSKFSDAPMKMKKKTGLHPNKLMHLHNSEVGRQCLVFKTLKLICERCSVSPSGTRESAFVYALAAAAISHTIARACTSGDLRLCTCGPIPGDALEPGHRWGGCTDNLHYGLIMGSKFSDAPMKMKKKTGLHPNKLMHLHNSEVGRQALKDALVMKCKCHGVSGSCSIRTCWRGLQDLKEIAQDLKTKYLSATRVKHQPTGTRKQLVPKDIDVRPVRENELVYLQSSPDFCTKNEKMGSIGTQDSNAAIRGAKSFLLISALGGNGWPRLRRLTHTAHAAKFSPERSFRGLRFRCRRVTLSFHVAALNIVSLALKDALVMKCKCHGVSGSCSIRTCWRGLQDLKEIAQDLKTKYLSATRVKHQPTGTRKQLVPKDIDVRPVRENELVYLQSSPDFCTKNEKMGSIGTQDRQCNKTSSGSDSCDLMCCGRGYNPYTEKVVERCHCKYHWCCYVTCKKCERTVERYVCK